MVSAGTAPRVGSGDATKRRKVLEEDNLHVDAVNFFHAQKNKMEDAANKAKPLESNHVEYH